MDVRLLNALQDGGGGLEGPPEIRRAGGENQGRVEVGDIDAEGFEQLVLERGLSGGDGVGGAEGLEDWKGKKGEKISELVN